MYAKYIDFGMLSSFAIKSETCKTAADWMYQPLDQVEFDDTEEFIRTVEAALEGARFKMNLETTSRDGCFEPEHLFVVWEKEDLEAMIARLQEALKDGYPT